MMQREWLGTRAHHSLVASTSGILMKRQGQQRLSDLYFKMATFFTFFINLRVTYLFEL